MHTEGDEVHTEGDEARAGSTPNIVRWILGISLLAAILLLSGIWIFGAASTDEEDRVANVTDRSEAGQQGEATDSIVSDRSEFEFGEPASPPAGSADDSGAAASETTPTPE